MIEKKTKAFCIVQSLHSKDTLIAQEHVQTVLCFFSLFLTGVANHLYGWESARLHDRASDIGNSFECSL